MYDVAIAGGGISGLAVALEASRRGYSVILLEKNRCGQATSQSSLRIMHGGFRYLQTLHLSRVVQSLQAQHELLTKYGDIIKPLPCLMPLQKNGMKSFLPVWCALRFYSLLYKLYTGSSYKGRILTVGEVSSISFFNTRPVTRTLCWFDALLTEPAQLIECLKQEAQKHNATIEEGRAILSIVREANQYRLATTREEVVARHYINAAGSSIESLRPTGMEGFPRVRSWCRGFNLILKKQIDPKFAITLMSRKGRLLFAVPRGNATVVGTEYVPCPEPHDAEVSQQEIDNFQLEVIEALHDSGYSAFDIEGIESGVLPLTYGGESTLTLQGSEKIFAQDNYIEVLSTKYTTFLSQARQICDCMQARVD